MGTSTATLPKIVQDYVVSAVTTTFAAYGAALSSAPGPAPAAAGGLVAVMGLFVADYRASLVLLVSPDVLKATHPSARVAATATGLTDWIGELTNLTVGALKLEFLRHGLVLRITPPSVTAGGPEVLDDYKDRGIHHIQSFRSASGGGVSCMMVVDADDGFVLPPADETAALPQAGDVIIV